MKSLFGSSYQGSLYFSFHLSQCLLKAEEHSWSLAELIHAVVLLTHYHSLASFTFGCGITPEIHCDGGHTFRPPSLSQYCVCDIANGNGHANHHDDPLGNQVSGQGWRLFSELECVSGFLTSVGNLRQQL